MKKIDTLITGIFLLVIVVLYFMGSCGWDMWALIIGSLVALIICMVWGHQSSKQDKIEDELNKLLKQQ